jgi:hypothetical protein
MPSRIRARARSYGARDLRAGLQGPPRAPSNAGSASSTSMRDVTLCANWRRGAPAAPGCLIATPRGRDRPVRRARRAVHARRARQPAQRVFVIVDNGSAHRGKKSIQRFQGSDSAAGNSSTSGVNDSSHKQSACGAHDVSTPTSDIDLNPPLAGSSLLQADGNGSFVTPTFSSVSNYGVRRAGDDERLEDAVGIGGGYSGHLSGAGVSRIVEPGRFLPRFDRPGRSGRRRHRRGARLAR